MKLAKENWRLRGMLAGGVVECLSHIHNRPLDPLALFPPQSPKEQVQALFRTVFPSEPAGPLPPQVTDHNPVGMPIAERTLVDSIGKRALILFVPSGFESSGFKSKTKTIKGDPKTSCPCGGANGSSPVFKRICVQKDIYQ